MKHLKPDFVLLGIILVFSGCIHVANVPQIPTLIVPEDGAVFEAEPPTFIWTSDSLFLADAYVIIILKDSLRSEDTLVYETLEDTTYTMPQDIFNSADSGTYCWVAAVHWIDGNVETTAHGDPRTFVIKKSESPAGLDLDTTYFPFGLGYEWCYERHVWGYDYRIEPEKWSKYDTFTNLVTDSFWNEDTLCFQINGSIVKIWDDQIYCDVLSRRIDLKPKTDTSYTDGSADCRLWIIGDTLLGVSLVVEYFETTSYSWSKQRLIGIGPISRNYSNVDGSNYSDNACDRLLYFYNGKDTVYKAD